jgi:hypothetical protein
LKCAKSGWPVSGHRQVNSGSVEADQVVALRLRVGEDLQLLAADCARRDRRAGRAELGMTMGRGPLAKKRG